MAGEDEFRPVDEDRRLDRLDARLDKLHAEEARRTGTDTPTTADPNYRMGSRVLADLVGGIAGGALLGWLFDRLFGTWPWGFMVLLFMGIIVAFRNIMRIAGGVTSTPPEDDEKTG